MYLLQKWYLVFIFIIKTPFISSEAIKQNILLSKKVD